MVAVAGKVHQIVLERGLVQQHRRTVALVHQILWPGPGVPSVHKLPAVVVLEDKPVRIDTFEGGGKKRKTDHDQKRGSRDDFNRTSTY